MIALLDEGREVKGLPWRIVKACGIPCGKGDAVPAEMGDAP